MQLSQAMDTHTVGALLAEKMSQYASLLAAQGSIAAALAFLPDNTNQVTSVHLHHCFILFLRQVPGCPGACFVNQANLKFRDTLPLPP